MMGTSDARRVSLESAPTPALARPVRLGPRPDPRPERGPGPGLRSALASLSVPLVRLLKRAGSHLPLHRQAALVAKLLPARHWYAAALTISRAQGRLVERMGGNRALSTHLMLDHWLRELSFAGPYPIPHRSEGLEVCLTPGAKLFTWTHLPLTEVPMRLYFEGGGAPVAVVSDEGKIVGENQFQVFGWPERQEALLADAHLVSRVVRVLRSGKSVVYLSDHYLGGPMSDVPARTASRLGVPLVCQWAELDADGTLVVTYRNAPYPYANTEAEIAENMEFLRESRNRTLERLGWGVLLPE